MIFALRCVDVSLTFFVVLYCVLSFTVTRSWRPCARVARRLSPRLAANLLFVLRIAPVSIASAVTAIFVLPSFLLLEPRSVPEPLGETPLALSVCCVLLAMVGIRSAIRAQARSAQALALWMKEATPVAHAEPTAMYRIPMYRIRPAVPALTVAGVCVPRVLISDEAALLLTSPEMQTAVRHELAHVRHRDNLKKLLFRLTVFPGMKGLEAAWSEQGEMAADDAAVANASDALDLASALIKLSRLAPWSSDPMPASALVSGSSASQNARVERLVAWSQAAQAEPSRLPWYVVPTALGVCMALAVSYGAVLMDMHKVTEWLVR